jgi:hypothetical protein
MDCRRQAGLMGTTEEFAGDLVALVVLLLGVVCGRGVLGVVVALADQLGLRHNPAPAPSTPSPSGLTMRSLLGGGSGQPSASALD